MGAAVCIALFVLFVLIVLGRGTGKSVAQAEVAARKAAKATPVIAKAGAHKAVELGSVAGHKAVDVGQTGLGKGTRVVTGGAAVTKIVAQSTGSTVRNAFRSCREQYRETKAKQLNS